MPANPEEKHLSSKIERPPRFSPEELSKARIPEILTESIELKVRGAIYHSDYDVAYPVILRPWTPREVAGKSIIRPLVVVQHANYVPLGFAELKTTYSSFILRDGRHDRRERGYLISARRVFATWLFLAGGKEKRSYSRNYICGAQEQIRNRCSPHYDVALALVSRFGALSVDAWWKTKKVAELAFHTSTTAARRDPRKAKQSE